MISYQSEISTMLNAADGTERIFFFIRNKAIIVWGQLQRVAANWVLSLSNRINYNHNCIMLRSSYSV